MRLLPTALLVLSLSGCASRRYGPTVMAAMPPMPVLPPGTSGAIHLTFSQQGAETLRTVSGDLIHSVGVASVNVCDVTGTDKVRPAAMIYDAARLQGISTISPLLVQPLLDRTHARSKSQNILDGLSIASGVMGALGTTKAVKMGNGGAAALSLGPIAIALFREFVAKRLPNDSPVRANLLNGDIGIPAHGCGEYLFLYLYQGNWNPREAFIP